MHVESCYLFSELRKELESAKRRLSLFETPDDVVLKVFAKAHR